MTEKEFKEKQDDILYWIPSEIKPALSHMAWESGHYAGYDEVINHLQDLVDNLETPLSNLMGRVADDVRKVLLSQGLGR